MMQLILVAYGYRETYSKASLRPLIRRTMRSSLNIVRSFRMHVRNFRSQFYNPIVALRQLRETITFIHHFVTSLRCAWVFHRAAEVIAVDAGLAYEPPSRYTSTESLDRLEIKSVG